MSNEAPLTVADTLEAAAALVDAQDLDPISAINSAVHGSPETRTGSPITAEAKSALIRSLPKVQLAEWPTTSYESVLGHWRNQDHVGQKELAEGMRHAAQLERAGQSSAEP